MSRKVEKPSLGLFGILGNAFKTSIRNGRLLLFITIIMFSHNTMMGLADRFLLQPRKEDFDADPELCKACIKVLVMLSSLCLVLTFSAAASVHSTFEANTAKVLSLTEILLGTKRRWKRALTTSIWMITIILTGAAFLNFVLGVIGGMAGDSVSSALKWILFILGGDYIVYLYSLLMLGLVVSVIEENLSGLKAITEANELMKGKKRQGNELMVIMVLVCWAMFKASGFLATATTTQNAKLAIVVDSAISIPGNLAYAVLTLFVFVVYTLFYHECKKNQAVEENAALYAPISDICSVQV